MENFKYTGLPKYFTRKKSGKNPESYYDYRPGLSRFKRELVITEQIGDNRANW